VLLSGFIHESIASLEHLYPSPEARGMVLILCEEKLGVRNYTHIVEPQTSVPEDRISEMREYVRRLGEGEPLQYVLGFADFMGRRFKVSPSVLIPRPETEMLVEEALKVARAADDSVRVLDLCTGSGCIAWSVLKELSGAEVVAVDISPEALDVARSQSDGASPEFVKADVLKGPEGFGRGMFDIILSNPPYIMEKEKPAMRTNVLKYEPSLALFVPDDDALVFYRAIVSWLDALLKPGGTGIVEINEALGPATRDVFTAAGYKETAIVKDFFGKDRFLKIRKQLPAGL